MISTDLRQAQNCILHLQTSLESTSKNIQNSREIIYALQQSYQSSHAHHSITVHKRHFQSLHLNINMEVEDGDDRKVDEEPNIEYVRVNGEKYIKERTFGKLTKKLRFEETGGNRVDVEETDERELRRQIQDKETPMKSSLPSSRKVEQQKRMPNTSTANHGYSTNESPQKKTVRSQQSEQSRTPIRKPQLNVEETSKEKMSSKRSKSRKPIFQKEHHKSLQEEHVDYDQRFRTIKKELSVAEDKEWLIQKRKSRQEQRPKYVRMPKEMEREGNETAQRIHRQMNQLKNDFPVTNTKDQRAFQSRVSQNTPNAKPHQKSRSRSPLKSESPDKRPKLLQYFSRSQYYIRAHGVVRCDKFKREIEKETRQRYLSDALKIPGVDRYFTYSQLYQFYIAFRKMDLPEYKWIQFLDQKLRSAGKLLVTEQRYTAT